MKQTLEVKIEGNRNYNIDITSIGLENFMREIDEYTKGQKRLIVISKKVYKLYSKILKLNKDELYIFPDGEKEKNYKNYIKILERAIKMGLTRKDVIIALGGGVVGDIAGFAASTYMRGIDFIQVPTTLLSAVDSSVGGKTAIDVKEAKNIVGSFYQPKKVFININFLNTLDERQFMSGLGEVIKYAFIEDSCNYENKLFLSEYLTLSVNKIMSKEPATIARLIECCLKLKIAVVTQDEKEGGLRKILNLGHTYAHALETITRYRKYTHGEAVIYGIFLMLDWAQKKGLITDTYYKLSIELLEKYGFKPLEEIYPSNKIVAIMKKDKKASSDKITFIVPFDKKQVTEIALYPAEAEAMLPAETSVSCTE